MHRNALNGQYFNRILAKTVWVLHDLTEYVHISLQDKLHDYWMGEE